MNKGADNRIASRQEWYWETNIPSKVSVRLRLLFVIVFDSMYLNKEEEFDVTVC